MLGAILIWAVAHYALAGVPLSTLWLPNCPAALLEPWWIGERPRCPSFLAGIEQQLCRRDREVRPLQRYPAGQSPPVWFVALQASGGSTPALFFGPGLSLYLRTVVPFVLLPEL